ncbi:glyoxylate utilization-related uncharacterized protein [Rhizobium sp. BK196]|jgi:hypothetical protein|nr:glyoxylate utilization-related uncharacterized protein [Rhizobium sp. BK196]MBB3463260.1 glyoxylate utilization-related uncharacterized protein [Rhizobium sp. BK377]
MFQHLQNCVGAILGRIPVGTPDVDPGLAVLDVKPGAALPRLRTPIMVHTLFVLA